jgi:hypothetical protein
MKPLVKPKKAGIICTLRGKIIGAFLAPFREALARQLANEKMTNWLN